MATYNAELNQFNIKLTKGINSLFNSHLSENNYNLTDDKIKNNLINNYVDAISKDDNPYNIDSEYFLRHYDDDFKIYLLKGIMLDELRKREKILILNRREEAYAKEFRDILEKSDLLFKKQQQEAHVKVLTNNLENNDMIGDVTSRLSNIRIGGGYKKTSNSKINSKKVSNKPDVSQKKHSIYKEILGKKMKIYKMPDSQKEYVKYKGELHHISDYKDLMKQKAKPKAKSNK